MKKLSIFTLVAALVGSACDGTGNFGPVNEIEPSNTLYITLDLPAGAAESPDSDFNTSCRNPGDAIGDGVNVATVLQDLIDFAYDENFGVIHLCAGEYLTDDPIVFDNLGSITIQGDGIGETIISGAAGDSHPLLVMVPVCPGEGDDVVCPSNFNVLTLKDLTLTGGDATEGEYEGLAIGGAVTAPLIATEHVEFSDNVGICGGAIALYGWTIATSSTTFLDGLGEAPTPEEALNAISAFDTTNHSLISETTFRNNSAFLGGAIAGVGAVISGEGEFPSGWDLLSYLACQNPGPLEISGSLFDGNFSESAEGGVYFGDTGGGAIVSLDSRAFMLFALAIELDEGLFESSWLSEATSAWADSASTDDPWLTVTETSFNGNHANGSGGAIAAVGNVVITNSSFTENYADDDGDGGALYVSGGLTLTKSKFLQNSASTGGAIMIQGLFGDDLTLTRNTFTRNIAADQGGAISGWVADGVARGNRFTSNRAPLGSAVAVETERCSRTVSRRTARDWRGNTFRQNRGGRLPVECFAFAEPT